MSIWDKVKIYSYEDFRILQESKITKHERELRNWNKSQKVNGNENTIQKTRWKQGSPGRY